jgi:hypothetical protein
MTAPSLNVKTCPRSGVHTWLFHAACCAVEAGLSDDQAAEEMWEEKPFQPESKARDILIKVNGTIWFACFIYVLLTGGGGGVE